VTNDSQQTDPDYVRAIVKAHDRDRYVATLFAPEPYRSQLFSLQAFNVELSRIAGLVTEPMLGEVRLQWWRDALDQLEHGERLGHPVADCLGDVMRARNLPKMQLLGLIDARSFDITGTAMPDMPALRTYLAKTAGALFQLSADILTADRVGEPIGRATRSAIVETAGAGGMAYGLAELLRALPLHVSRGILFLPVSHFDDFGVAREMRMGGEECGPVKAAFSALVEVARDELREAEKTILELPPAVRLAFLPLAFVAPYLDRLGRSSHRPLHDLVELNPLGRLIRAWRARRSGGFENTGAGRRQA